MTEAIDRDLQRKVARAELSRRAFIVSIAFVTMSVVAALFTLTLAIRSTQLEGTPTGRKLVASADRILDCTSPEGDCYKRSQQRTGDAVSALNSATARIVAAALSCQADGETTEKALLDCITQRLEDGE